MRSNTWLGGFAIALAAATACGGSNDDNPGTGATSSGAKGGKDGGGVGGSGTGASGGTSASGGVAGGTAGGGAGAGGTAGTGATGATGGGGPCVQATCQGHQYQCGDCIDNDGDGLIDAYDPDCWGVCQDNESGYKGNIPGQKNQPCIADCYFDQDSGAGNDSCYWDHRCDPYEVAPDYPPEGSGCPYDANTKVISGGPPESCDTALNQQSQTCANFCGPLTPNGCDCFGCCVVAGAATPIYLGSESASGQGSCDLKDVADPSKCKPCTIVKGCFNDCKTCELCIGKTQLPPECNPGTGGAGGTTGGGGSGGTTSGGGTGGSCAAPLCGTGVQSCGVSCLPPCATGYYCVTGCCQKVPG